MEGQYLLEMLGISKEFPGVKAIKQVDFRVGYGEVHALMGENGAGKSTLMKILNGIYSSDTGTIRFDGQTIHPQSSLEAQKLGISTIYQELNLIPELSICENIYIGREPMGRLGINWRKMEKDARLLLGQIGLSYDVKQPLSLQGAAVAQMVAIARALAIKSKLVVMDEPTSSLDENEVKILFQVIRTLKEQGISVIFISHRLKEIYEICDKITILKDGECEGCYGVHELDQMALVSKMIGQKVENSESRLQDDDYTYNGEPLCIMKGITNSKVKDVSFEMNPGEVLGFAGLLGSGRTELIKVLFGADTDYEGSIEVDRKKVRFKIPGDAIRQGIALCPEERRTEGIIPNLSVRENISIVLLPRLTKAGIISRKAQEKVTEEFIKSLGIKTPNMEQAVKNLSGGNQQKVLLARWLCTHPRLVIMDEPTRGIDVGAKAEIERLVRNMAKDGMSVVMISSEISEVVRNSNRVMVMRDGKKLGELTGADINQDEIMFRIAENKTFGR
ncbi:sugar ABC transporter ATP-binding protein [Lachnospiraceae bacterium 62-35]